MSFLARVPALIGAVAALAALAACASFPSMKVAPQGGRPPNPAAAALAPFVEPGAKVDTAAPATPDDIARLVGAPDEKLDAELPPQPLPQMLNTVFGDILKVPYVLGPNVGSRTEFVTLRGVAGMTRRDFIRMVQVALRDYALKIVIRGGTVNIVDDPTPNISSATYLSARASQDTPQSSQPVTAFFTAKAIDIEAALTLMADIDPAARDLGLTPDPDHNSVVITGRTRDVDAAAGMLRALDQPMFAGVGVVRVEPVYWSAQTLAQSLQDTLEAQGYSITGSPQTPRTVLVMAFADEDQVLIFARDPTLLSQARDWAAKLDQPSELGGRITTFIYQAQNTEAKSLAALVRNPEVGGGGAFPSQPVGLPGTPPAAVAAANEVAPATGVGRGMITSESAGPSGPAPAGGFMGGRLIVDEAGNRIVFTGTADDFTELRKLLVALDTPQRQVLVEVTIAEVTLDDQTNIGMEWMFTHSMTNGAVLTGGTLNGLGIGTSGLNLNYTANWAGLSVQAAFNAFASNNKVNILSRPRLVAMSGAEASIQVGTDVPIITSQATNPTQTTGATNILQSIEYRQTGTILHIKPVVYGDNRVDIVITQEVSSEEANSNSAIASPEILDRNLTTQLSLADGATAVLGGLMDDEYSKANSGIPILKDIPFLGNLARTDTISGDKTELVMLVTPYILREGDDMSRWAGRYSDEMNAAFRIGRGWSYTLTAWNPLPGVSNPTAVVP
jgi:general secretion pathway protein D